jgi:hypothetical protein
MNRGMTLPRKRPIPGAWQGAGSSPPTEEPPPHPLGPTTPVGVETPDFGLTGATGMDESTEDESMIRMRIDTPLLPELQTPVQAFHSTEIEERGQDPRENPPLSPLPLSANQTETLATKPDEATDIFVQEKFIVPTAEQPSERWTIGLFLFPGADPQFPTRVADRQERRNSCLLVNTGATTISIGPSQSSLVPFLLAGAALKLDTLAPIFANSSGGSLIVIEELSE